MVIIALLVCPAAGALLTAVAPRRSAPVVAAIAAVLTFALAIAAVPGSRGEMHHRADASWIPALGVRFSVGVDGISAPLLVLTTLLSLLCVIYSRVERVENERAFLALILLIELGMLGTFVALDLVLFIIAFETVVVPMYFLIAQWGGARRDHASMKFALYTVLGSVLLIVGAVTVYSATHSFALIGNDPGAMSHTRQVFAFLLFFLAFAVKSPLWPLHTWLPDAHTEAPTAGSVLLAGVLLKMGTYGLIRVALPLAPEGAHSWAPVMGILAVGGIVVGSACCLVQRDLKRLIAYSSVGHMGFVVLGIATLTTTGINAALFANVAHGLITGLLFFLVGALKSRNALGGALCARAPRLGGIVVFACMASLGLPGLAGFWGEALALFGALRRDALFIVLAGVAAAGLMLTAGYFLMVLRRYAMGRAEAEPVPDVQALEWVAWAPLVLLTVVVGVYPNLLLHLTDPAVQALTGTVR